MNRTDCPCKRVNCPRHGDCEACQAHHQVSKRSRPCERQQAKKADNSPARRRESKR